MADVRVKGLADLNKFLQQLPAKVEQSVLRGALRAGANVVMAEAKANVPVDSGLLRDGLKVTTNSRRGRVTAKVKATGKHSFIAPWLEYGTAAHKIVAKSKRACSSVACLSKACSTPAPGQSRSFARRWTGARRTL